MEYNYPMKVQWKHETDVHYIATVRGGNVDLACSDGSKYPAHITVDNLERFIREGHVIALEQAPVKRTTLAYPMVVTWKEGPAHAYALTGEDAGFVSAVNLTTGTICKIYGTVEQILRYINQGPMVVLAEPPTPANVATLAINVDTTEATTKLEAATEAATKLATALADVKSLLK